MFLESIFNLGSYDWLLLLALLIVGIIIIVVVVKILLFVLPAAIIALVVWYLTGGDLTLTGLAFIAVALISILKR